MIDWILSVYIAGFAIRVALGIREAYLSSWMGFPRDETEVAVDTLLCALVWPVRLLIWLIVEPFGWAIAFGARNRNRNR